MAVDGSSRAATGVHVAVGRAVVVAAPVDPDEQWAP